ncbi:MAG TPA: ester cyclase [Solirubrobacteraceae bacterium]|jgi:predicted ester cyclase
MTTTQHDYAARARAAIEIVCAGDLSRMEDFYSPTFVDHVNDATFHGYEGGHESVSFYRAIFKDLRMGVEEQVSEGRSVASRWVLTGSLHGRRVTLRGTTISRFDEDGRIVEDHGHTDTISLLRQLGMLRTLLLGVALATRRVKLPKGALTRAGANTI